MEFLKSINLSLLSVLVWDRKLAYSNASKNKLVWAWKAFYKYFLWWINPKDLRNLGVFEIRGYLRDWPAMKWDPSPGNFRPHFLFGSKIKTNYPGVHPPISSLTLRPKLGLWWSYHVLDPILQGLTRLTKQHKAQ